MPTQSASLNNNDGDDDSGDDYDDDDDDDDDDEAPQFEAPPPNSQQPESFNPAIQASLINLLIEQLKSNTAAANLNELRGLLASADSQEARNDTLFARFNEPRSRLLKELESLSWRGNLNLTLGAFTTMTGVALLGWSVFSEVTTIKDTWAFISHFVPRLTLVILIELFAFFFLSLYKSSLSEIKYFQNELTNIEAKLLALRAAITHGDKKVVADIITKLAATDRNHVLTKNQTTVELEKAKMDQHTENMVLKHIASFFNKEKPPHG